MSSEQIAAAVILPVLALASVVAAKAVGRWFAKQLSETMGEAVTNIVKPHLATLSTQLDDMRSMNTIEHAESQERLSAIEKRLDDFIPTPELLKRHAEIVERLDFLTDIARHQHPSEFPPEEDPMNPTRFGPRCEP